jgi:DNA-binding MarR family transcriptional regulator
MKITQFFRPKETIQAHHTYGLTPLGKTKAEELTLEGKRGLVASHLNENGACSLNEIAEGTNLTPEKAKRIVHALIRNGYVRKVNSEE